MSADRAALTVASAGTRQRSLDAVLSAVRRRPTGGHLLFVIVACAAAFHYSLITLLTSLADDTPLANLALVPVVALVLAAAAARPRRQEPAIHDRELDWIIGVPLLLAAVAMSVLVRDHWSGLYWAWRLDLLALPVFVAGVIAMVFGTRMLWRVRVAVLFLLAAWPVPTGLLVTSVTDDLAQVAAWVVAAILRVVPVASPAAGEAWLLSVGAGTERFEVAITQACAGAYGLVGFAVVGGAVVAAADGTRLRKVSWFTLGLVLTWLLNIARILLLLALGDRWGEQAIVELHPHLGFVTFAAAALVMVASLSRVGLTLPTPSRERRAALLPRPTGKPAIVVVAVAALALATVNADLRRFALVSEPLGTPLILSFEGTGAPVTPAGWEVTGTEQASQLTSTSGFFGDGSSWSRYHYADESAPLGTPAVVVDVVTTTHPRELETRGVAESYGFRQEEVWREEAVDLAGGVTATATSFKAEENGEPMTTLHWVWPVQTAAGRMYERIVLMTPTHAPPPGQQIQGQQIQGQQIQELSRLGRDLITQARTSSASDL